MDWGYVLANVITFGIPISVFVLGWWAYWRGGQASRIDLLQKQRDECEKELEEAQRQLRRARENNDFLLEQIRNLQKLQAT